MIDANKQGEIDNAEHTLAILTEPGTQQRTKPFGIQWPAVWWVKWATIHHALRTLRVPQGATRAGHRLRVRLGYAAPRRSWIRADRR